MAHFIKKKNDDDYQVNALVFIFFGFILFSAIHRRVIFFPTPGIEPGRPEWEPDILTTRPCRKNGHILTFIIRARVPRPFFNLFTFCRQKRLKRREWKKRLWMVNQKLNLVKRLIFNWHKPWLYFFSNLIRKNNVSNTIGRSIPRQAR